MKFLRGSVNAFDHTSHITHHTSCIMHYEYNLGVEILSPHLSAYMSVICKNDNPKKVGVNFEKRTYSDTYTNA